MIVSLLYVSQSLLKPSDEKEQIGNILSVAKSRNSDLNVTGALVYTQARFAQILEGPKPSLDELMASIRRDERHTDVEVVLTEELTKRRFSAWSLAYNGPSSYIDRHIKPLLQFDISDEHTATRANRLMAVIEQLVHQSV